MWRQEMGEFLPAGETPRQWVLETHSSIMACQMAVDGAGIAFLDRLSARGLDTSGVTFKPLNPQKWITFGFIRRDVGSINPNVESFISSLHRSIDQLRTGNPEIKDCVAKLDSGYGLVSQA
jgi:DNA-binding transcriptional LysR family regulator